MSTKDLKSLADANRSQLAVIDIQSRLSKVMHNRDLLLKNSNILIEAAKLLEVPITVTEQYPKGIGHTEQQLIDSLSDDYKPVEKTCFSCAGSDSFNKSLEQHNNRDQIILCGIEAHVCVLQTALELLSDNSNTTKQVFIVADAVDSRAEKNKNIALNRLKQAGAIITCTESVLFEWMKDSTNKNFKQISALIR